MTTHPKIWLPNAATDLIDRIAVQHRHPGLQLDKLSLAGEQKDQSPAIDAVTECTGDSALLEELLQRRNEVLGRLGAARFKGRMLGPMTLHLSRAGGLENAGLALHPVYGFAWLPGTGLKGMTRAWAETVCKKREDAYIETDKRRIVDAFGNGEHSGRIVFHDAWPARWPKLERDIVNVHHKPYYEGTGMPADREDPVPSYFIVIAAGTEFDFALSDLRPRDDGLLEDVMTWMRMALRHEGAGAKIAAGYGRIVPVGRDLEAVSEQPALPPQTRLRREHDLTLVSPAFLAGARQEEADCDLRPATLRGLLRWWWRTMHAGHLNLEDLARMEAAIWGDTRRGSAVSLSIRESGGNSGAVRYDKKKIKQRHLQRSLEKQKVTQGLFYVSYGMDEKGEDRRWYRPPDDQWRLTLTARPTSWSHDGYQDGPGIKISADAVMRQAEAALWLLARYGGVGSKSRKGFGSFADVAVEDVSSPDDCILAGAALREHCGLKTAAGTGTPALEHRIGPVEVETQWRDDWHTLDQVGEVYQRFAKGRKLEERMALGQPRKHVKTRYASPAFWSLARREDRYSVRLLCFPSNLPDSETSQKILKDLSKQARKELEAASRTGAGRKSPRKPSPPQNTSTLKNGQRVSAELLKERTKKGGWRAKEVITNIEGHIHNNDQVPADAQPGQAVDLIVKSARPKDADFLWPTAEVEADLERSKSRIRKPARRGR